MKKPHNLGFYIEDELLNKFNDYCKEHALSKSAFIRMLIEKAVNPKPPASAVHLGNGVWMNVEPYSQPALKPVVAWDPASNTVTSFDATKDEYEVLFKNQKIYTAKDDKDQTK